MAAKPSSPQFEFIVEQLRKSPNASYAEINAAAEKKGLKIFPIMYGRAQVMLGLRTASKRGTGKVARKAKVAAAESAPKVAAPKAPRSAPPIAGGLESIIAHVKAADTERERYRAAIEKIRAILDDLA